MTTTVELVDEAETIGVPTSLLRPNEPLEDILYLGRLEVEFLPQVVKVGQFVADLVHGAPVEFCLTPEQCCRRSRPYLLDNPCSSELG